VLLSYLKVRIKSESSRINGNFVASQIITYPIHGHVLNDFLNVISSFLVQIAPFPKFHGNPPILLAVTLLSNKQMVVKTVPTTSEAEVIGWMLLLVWAHQGSPRQRAVKQLLLYNSLKANSNSFLKCRENYHVLTSWCMTEEDGADNAGHCVPKECRKQPSRSW